MAQEDNIIYIYNINSLYTLNFTIFWKKLRKFKEVLMLDSTIIEANYLIGVCHLGYFEYDKSIKEFN